MNMLRLTALLLCTLPSGLATAADKPFRAGAATSNLTPWLGTSINGNMSDVTAGHVHDELHARAFVLDDGTTKLAVVVCDACMIPREVVTLAKQRIAQNAKIAPDHVLISATHAHSCGTLAGVFQSDPATQYPEYFAAKVADAVQRAANNLAPAKIGWGFGRNDRQVFNRRWKMKPGTVPADPFGRKDDTVKMNPGVGSPDNIEPAGPIDPDVPVLSLQTPDGKPLALLANYSLHYVGGVGLGHLSADYYGVFCDRVEQLMNADRQEPPFVAAMSNGTSGDINNIDFRNKREPSPPYGRIKLVGDELAQEAVRVAKSLDYKDRVTLDGRTAELSLAVRKPTPADLSRAESIVAKAAGPVMKGLEEVYARETTLIAKYPDKVPVTIQALRIGDHAIVAIPCEVFVEIGLELKAKSPFKETFTIELANGYNGYLPTKQQHAWGGYETWRARSSYLEVDAAEKITKQALELLNALKAVEKP